MAASVIHVCLGIPTFCRNDSLRELLYALERLAPSAPGVSVDVVVFDNDPQRGAEDVVSMNRTTCSLPVRYRHVSPPGLSNVRNAALKFAEQHADLLVMIDDDEIPEPQWLNELLHIRAATGAAVVVGPVRATLPDNSPSWLRAFRESEYPIQRDGAALSDGWSSNFLLDLGLVAAMGLRFDSAMNLTGGEDQLYFRQILARGGVIRYAANATVWESLPASRRSLLSILKRSFRRGGSLTMCDQRMKGSVGSMALRLAKGGALVALGLAAVVPTWVTRGTSAAVMSLCEIARGLGMLAALIGWRSEAYGHRAS